MSYQIISVTTPQNNVFLQGKKVHELFPELFANKTPTTAKATVRTPKASLATPQQLELAKARKTLVAARLAFVAAKDALGGNTLSSQALTAGERMANFNRTRGALARAMKEVEILMGRPVRKRKKTTVKH